MASQSMYLPPRSSCSNVESRRRSQISDPPLSITPSLSRIRIVYRRHAMSTRIAAEVPQSNIVSISPVTGELLHEYKQHSDETVEGKLMLAVKQFREYRNLPFARRSQMMTRAAEILESDKEVYGRLMTQEMGKPLRAALQEAEKCPFASLYYAQNTAQFLP